MGKAWREKDRNTFVCHTGNKCHGMGERGGKKPTGNMSQMDKISQSR